jgi:hypothetical protein
MGKSPLGGLKKELDSKNEVLRGSAVTKMADMSVGL